VSFSAEVLAAIQGFGIDPLRTAYHSSWQNPVAERWVGTCRREPFDHVILFGERHLRRLLADYLAYSNSERVHTDLGNSPEARSIGSRPSPAASVVGLRCFGRLHHRYAWAEAA
jgi:transposase InsO family protein